MTAERYLAIDRFEYDQGPTASTYTDLLAYGSKYIMRGGRVRKCNIRRLITRRYYVYRGVPILNLLTGSNVVGRVSVMKE